MLDLFLMQAMLTSWGAWLTSCGNGKSPHGTAWDLWRSIQLVALNSNDTAMPGIVEQADQETTWPRTHKFNNLRPLAVDTGNSWLVGRWGVFCELWTLIDSLALEQQTCVILFSFDRRTSVVKPWNTTCGLWLLLPDFSDVVRQASLHFQCPLVSVSCPFCASWATTKNCPSFTASRQNATFDSLTLAASEPEVHQIPHFRGQPQVNASKRKDAADSWALPMAGTQPCTSRNYCGYAQKV